MVFPPTAGNFDQNLSLARLDRRTDRHDVTLEATPSKYFDGGLKMRFLLFSENTNSSSSADVIVV